MILKTLLLGNSLLLSYNSLLPSVLGRPDSSSRAQAGQPLAGSFSLNSLVRVQGGSALGAALAGRGQRHGCFSYQ